MFGVAGVANRRVVVLASEEGHRVEPLPLAQQVAGGRLVLALGHHPVLHPDALVGVRIGPAGQRVEGRGPQGLPGAQTETGVVSGAAHRVAHEQARFQRRPEVDAQCPDSQQFVAAPHQQHRLAVGVAAD